jgi:hypothetical protein
MDLKTATPVEIDTELARIGGETAKHYDTIARAQRTIDMEREHPAPSGSVNQRRIDQAEALIEAAWASCDRLLAERAPMDVQFQLRGGWTRYYLVDSETGNGHVHYDMSHSRCSRVPSTRHYWLTSESGKPAAEVIEQAGSAVCTVCFQDAPVEVLSRPRGYHTPSELEKLAARAERERKAEAKRAKLITNPDGSPLRIGGKYGERINSVVSAERAVVDIRVWAKVYHRGLESSELADIEGLLTALAAKRGTDVETERAALESRYVAKCKREGVTP